MSRKKGAGGMAGICPVREVQGMRSSRYDSVEMASSERDWDREEARAWMFSALEVGDSAALGGDVRLELDGGTTVLVGRNGAGKSALLERIQAGAWGALGVVDDAQPDPGRFAVEIRRRDAPSVGVRYECRWRPPVAPEASEPSLPAGITDRGVGGEKKFADIEETCKVLGGEMLWQLADGILTRNDGTTDSLPSGRGLLNWWSATRLPFTFNKMVGILHHMLWWGEYIKTGVPRSYKNREAAVLPFPWPHGRAVRLERRYEHISASVRQLTLALAALYQSEPDRFDELVEIGRRVRIFSDLQVMLLPNPEHIADPRAPQQLVAVSVDGVNLGLASDGTLRVVEILTALVSGDVGFLFIEEPEIAVHPGLLARLLAEIDAYSSDRQIVLSTQSPQVVSWTRPESLRLVERSGGATRVRSLSDEERTRIDRYLNDEGTLGDYVYSGGIDG